jgi:hypothetical protein
LEILGAGPRGPKAVAAGEAWPPAGSAAADSAVVEVDSAAADSVVAVAAKVYRPPVANQDEI